MFTGIVESVGKIAQIEHSGTNMSLWIASDITDQLKVDQSVSHNGVCLTVEEIKNDNYRVTAIQETISKTNFSFSKIGDKINLERCMQLNGRLDGHIVQGHVDITAECIGIVEKQGSWEFCFLIQEQFASLIIEKGSITVNGISLTLFNVTKTSFKVAIIPYTYEHTNINALALKDMVNVEFDLIGKYVNRIKSLH